MFLKRECEAGDPTTGHGADRCQRIETSKDTLTVNLIRDSPEIV
jgi:hypothetical protein